MLKMIHFTYVHSPHNPTSNFIVNESRSLVHKPHSVVVRTKRRGYAISDRYMYVELSLQADVMGAARAARCACVRVE